MAILTTAKEEVRRNSVKSDSSAEGGGWGWVVGLKE